MRKVLVVMGLLGLGLAACNKDKEDPGGTGSEQMANEWWVELTQGGVDIYDLHHFKISTYNTASSRDSLWVDDLENGWGMKTKVGADLSSLTFATKATGGDNLYFDPASPTSFPEHVIITGGKVIPKAGRSRTGNVTDSIFMEVEFSDDPGTKYVLSGHARTAFAEDEY
ncbi:MAG: hypothetical protein EOO11_04065 [Chitinophagaceae bacterium]|nr:MAG: hypothetical protein EOO11_04065 [Chitinophagaceae bacterium]